MRRKNAPEDINQWWDNLSEKMRWQVFDSAWCWSLLRKGETIKTSMETVGYSQTAINKVLSKVDVSLRNAEHKKQTKPTFWNSKYDNNFKKLERKLNKYWSDEKSFFNFPGLCCYIGCDKRTYLDALTDERVPEEIVTILKSSKMKLEALQLKRIEFSPAGGIFNLKNNHNYTDKVEIKTEINEAEDISLDDKLIAQSNKILKDCSLVQLNENDVEVMGVNKLPEGDY